MTTEATPREVGSNLGLGAGLSWDGFNVRGDAQSVREVRRLVEFHAARSPERPNVAGNRLADGKSG